MYHSTCTWFNITLCLIIKTCSEFVSPGLESADCSNFTRQSVVKALEDLAGWAGARVITQLHPERSPWTTGEIVAHRCQETAGDITTVDVNSTAAILHLGVNK